MSSFIIECSRFNAANKDSNTNAVWKTTVKESVDVEPGDVIEIRNCFIDTKQSSQDTIVLAEDTTVSLTFGYFEVNDDWTDKQNLVNGPGAADFNYYVAYKSAAQQGLWESVTFDFTYNNEGYETIAGFQYQTVDGQTHNYTTSFTFTGPGEHGQQTFTNVPHVNVIEGSIKLTNAAHCHRNGFTFVQANLGNIQPMNEHLLTGYVPITVPAGEYDPDNLAKLITDAMQAYVPQFDATELYTEKDFLRRTDEFDPDQILLIKAGTRPRQFEGYGYFANGAIVPYWLGASQVVLSYDNDGRGVYSFSYLHTPYLDNHNTVFKQVVSGGRLYTLTHQSGIFLTNLNPPEFWEGLGFDLTKILVVPELDQGELVVDLNDLRSKTTRQYTGLQALFSDGNRRIGALQNETLESDDTVQLLAGLRQTENTGYYLVEVTTGGRRTYTYSDGSYSSISAIVSKQYNSNDFVTGFGDSSISYIHQGPPFALQNMTIRILDPITKQPVENLGENSTIFVQVNKK